MVVACWKHRCKYIQGGFCTATAINISTDVIDSHGCDVPISYCATYEERSRNAPIH